MKPTEIHQIWLGDDPIHDEAIKTRQFAKEYGFTYTLWSWPMLLGKFGDSAFGSALPEKRLWKYVEQFYTFHLLASGACFVVAAHAPFDTKLSDIQTEVDVYFGGSYNNPTMSIIGVADPNAAILMKNTVLAQHERSKDMLLFATESMLLPLMGNSFLQRMLLPCLRYNNITHSYLNAPDSVFPALQQAPISTTLQPQPPAIVKPRRIIQAKPVADDISTAQMLERMANPVEVLPPFWLPRNTTRVVIITNDAEGIEDYEYTHGDCIIHMNEARYAETLKYSVAASHILFVDAYPRSQIKTPQSFKNFRNIVFYDKRVEKKWKTEFTQQCGKLPSLMCCLATEFKYVYPDVPVLVLGAALSQHSTASQLNDRLFEETWIRERGCIVKVAADRYKCMFLLLQTDKTGAKFVKQGETWLKSLPKNCLYKFVSYNAFANGNNNAIKVSNNNRDRLGLASAIKVAMNWDWKYLFVGMDFLQVNVEKLLNLLDKGFVSGGQVCSTQDKLSYLPQAGMFFNRSILEGLKESERTLAVLEQQASLENHQSEFLPICYADVDKVNAVTWY